MTLATVTAYFYPEKFLCVDSGPMASADVIILLGGGYKKRQQKDIDHAELLWDEYKQRRKSKYYGYNT